MPRNMPKKQPIFEFSTYFLLLRLYAKRKTVKPVQTFAVSRNSEFENRNLRRFWFCRARQALNQRSPRLRIGKPGSAEITDLKPMIL